MISRAIRRINLTKEENRIIDCNVKAFDGLFNLTKRSCANKGCGYPLSDFNLEVFEIPWIGAVCGVCYDMYRSLSSPGLRDHYYFTKLHDQWKRDQDDNSRGSKRDKLGL